MKTLSKAAESTPVVKSGSNKITGVYPGFSKLPSKAGVYRCKLFHNTRKKHRNHSDYTGILQLTGSKARILVWAHFDGSFGLRLEKIDEKTFKHSPNYKGAR